MAIITKAKGLIQDVKTHWKQPAKGKQVGYKELSAYSVGGIGVQFILGVVGYYALNASSFLVTAAMGFELMDIQTMSVIATVIGLVIGPVRGMIIDNTRSKKGIFRPYLLYMGLPTAIICVLMVMLPYDQMEYRTKFIVFLVLYNLMNIFAPFLTMAYNSLPQVMSSNTDERATIYSISSVVYSIAPTISGVVVPLIGAVDQLSTYQAVIPMFCILGVIITVFAYFGTKERAIVAKKYVPRVRFMDALKDLVRNKYFWILYGTGWLSFIAPMVSAMFNWGFKYGLQNENMYALVTLLRGTAYLPGMLFAPLMIKRLGKRNLSIIAGFVQMASMALMIFFSRSLVMLFLCNYVREFAASISMVSAPAMKADILDYQQYKTGRRISGMMEQVSGTLGSVILMGTGYIMPFVLATFGGLRNNYDDMYNGDFLSKIIVILAISSVISFLISTIPWFFYDLSEKKHRNIVKVLRIRALFEDYCNGDLSQDQLTQTVEDIQAAQAIVENSSFDQSDKMAVAEFEAAQLTIAELNKFSTPEMEEKVKQAQQTVQAGPQRGLEEPDPAVLEAAIAMPEETKKEKAMRKAAIKAAENAVYYFNKQEKDYVQAKALLREQENFMRFEEILAEYEKTVQA